MRTLTLLFLLATATAAPAQEAIVRRSADGGTTQQLGKVVGVPYIWPAGADAGTPDAGTASSIKW